MAECKTEVLEKIDLNALYTFDQALKLLMEFDPSLSEPEARRELSTAIASGDLPIAGHFIPNKPR